MVNDGASLTTSFLLGMICKSNRDVAESIFATLGLHAGQERLLASLWEQEGLSQVELAQKMCVQPPTVNKMLTRLQSSGLVERRSDSEDTRFTRVYLTEKGRNMRQQAAEAFAQMEERVVANLSLEERLLLKRLLMQVYENLKDG